MYDNNHEFGRSGSFLQPMIFNNFASVIIQPLRKLAVILSPLLFFIFLMGSMKTSLLYAVYAYDTQLFITAFCENKNKPELHCNGKCQLAKMQQEQRDNSTEKLLKELQSEVLACPVPPCIDFARAAFAGMPAKMYPLFTQSQYNYLFTDPRKKPPQA